MKCYFKHNLYLVTFYKTILIDSAERKMDEGKCELRGSISMTKGLRYQGLLAFSKVRLLSRQTDARQMHRNQIPDRG